MITMTEKLKLSNENIAQVSGLAEKNFGEWGVDARNISSNPACGGGNYC